MNWQYRYSNWPSLFHFEVFVSHFGCDDIYDGRELYVPFANTLHIVRGQNDVNAIVDVRPLRVVIQFLGVQSATRHEAPARGKRAGATLHTSVPSLTLKIELVLTHQATLKSGNINFRAMASLSCTRAQRGSFADSRARVAGVVMSNRRAFVESDRKAAPQRAIYLPSSFANQNACIYLSGTQELAQRGQKPAILES
jgi:hypothetical protein